MTKQVYLAKDKVFGFSLWTQKPFYEGGIFRTNDYPYDHDKCHYIGEEFVMMFFNETEIPQIGEMTEVEITVKNS